MASPETPQPSSLEVADVLSSATTEASALSGHVAALLSATPPVSFLADEVRAQAFSPRLRALIIPDGAVELWETVVCFAQVMIDDSNYPDIEERLKAALEYSNLFDVLSQEGVDAPSSAITLLDKDRIESIAKRVRRPSFIKFARRLLGAASYDRLELALKKDCATLAIAVRRAMRAIMPYAVAIEDFCETLTPQQMAEISSLNFTQRRLISALVEIDKVLDKAISLGLPVEIFSIREEERQALEVAELDDLVDSLRSILSGRSRTALAELNDALNKKVQGARDALQYSADPVSQAANSLIELIDRLLRDAFTDEETLEWIATNYPNDPGLTYFDNDRSKLRPTKRGQALCFTYGGSPVSERSPFHEIAAAAIAASRAQLQKLKHADQGTREEQDAVSRFLSTIEGYLAFAISIGWSNASADRIQRFQSRLD